MCLILSRNLLCYKRLLWFCSCERDACGFGCTKNLEHTEFHVKNATDTTVYAGGAVWGPAIADHSNRSYPHYGDSHCPLYHITLHLRRIQSGLCNPFHLFCIVCCTGPNKCAVLTFLQFCTTRPQPYALAVLAPFSLLSASDPLPVEPVFSTYYVNTTNVTFKGHAPPRTCAAGLGQGAWAFVLFVVSLATLEQR